MNHKLAAFLYVKGLIAECATQQQIVTTTTQVEACLIKLHKDLDQVTSECDEVLIQSMFYEAGKLHFAQDLKWWFQVLYQILMQSDQGPRLGQFTKLMTAHWVQNKIDQSVTDYWLMPDTAHTGD